MNSSSVVIDLTSDSEDDKPGADLAGPRQPAQPVPNRTSAPPFREGVMAPPLLQPLGDNELKDLKGYHDLLKKRIDTDDPNIRMIQHVLLFFTDHRDVDDTQIIMAETIFEAIKKEVPQPSQTDSHPSAHPYHPTPTYTTACNLGMTFPLSSDAVSEDAPRRVSRLHLPRLEARVQAALEGKDDTP